MGAVGVIAFSGSFNDNDNGTNNISVSNNSEIKWFWTGKVVVEILFHEILNITFIAHDT